MSLAQSNAWGQVLLDPASGSYFELFDDIKVFGRGSDIGSKWWKAREFAQTRYHQGRRGRLAVIASRETHDFVTKNFQFQRNAWIGLRYMCGNRSLVWTTGERIDRGSDFQPWHPKWVRGIVGSGTTCSSGRNSYMPLYYTASRSPRWQASGPDKGFSAVLIEYPDVTQSSR